MTNQVQQVVDTMDPEEALKAITGAMKKLFSLLGEEAWANFVIDLVGASGTDKLASMVHL
jgi:hypothetical protein